MELTALQKEKYEKLKNQLSALKIPLQEEREILLWIM